MSLVRAIVLTGFGLNCDLETAHALRVAGAETERVHLNSLVWGERTLEAFQILVVGGGFSWGDDHGAGVIMAMRLRHRLGDALLQFVERGGVVVGICNGFQVLVNVGLLPGFTPAQLTREVALINNDCGNFRDHWVHLVVNRKSPCILTRGMEALELPIRHGEGKFHAEDPVVDRLITANQVFMRYAGPDGKQARGEFPFNPNGSMDDIAGICDPSGRIAGLMPHPEAFNHWTNHPDWTFLKERYGRGGKPLPEEGTGIALFRNAVTYFN